MRACRPVGWAGKESSFKSGSRGKGCGDSPGETPGWLPSPCVPLLPHLDPLASSRVETMIGCRSHSWVAPQGCLGVPWEGLALEARGLLPHSFWAATEAQAELLELLAASVCPDTCYCHDRMPSKTSILMRDTLKAERLLVLQ